MASIHQEVRVNVPPEQVWDAMRDVGALHTRLATGFVADCRMERDDSVDPPVLTRIVSFNNGMVVRELIVDVDDARRRVVWSAVGGRLSHHNASTQVFADGHGSRVLWIADLLPHAMAPAIEGMIRQGLAAMKKTLETA